MVPPMQAVYRSGVIAWIAAVVLVESISSASALPSLRLPATLLRPSAASLTVEPVSIQLAGPRSTARLLCTLRLPNGQVRDVTDRTTQVVADPALVRTEQNGTLRPLKDGVTTIRLTCGNLSATARVAVSGLAKPAPVSFSNEIVPLLTHVGCNQGACHGAQYGKGGFKLSLAGFDPDLDYLNIARQPRSRRISLADPTHSLLLLKPTMAMAHGGGRRLERNSPDYRLLLQWLREGAPGPQPTDPYVTRIDVLPSLRIMQPGEGTQRLIVRAVYSDGTNRDVSSR